MDIKIPKMTVVTFVENACVHGIEAKTAPGWIFVRICQKQKALYLEVEDTGCGMDASQMQELKERMLNASIDMLKDGGRVGIINACLRLKMVFGEQVAFRYDSEYPDAIVEKGRKKMGEALLKVLLVDDEPFILQGLKILIDWEQEGFEVVKTAANGEEALEYLRGEQVDLIIADIKMPVVTGLELLEKIRGEKISDAHFVILSGYADFEYARKAIRYDCTDYILKPVDREELLKVLNKVQVLRRADNQKKQSSREMEQAYLSRHLIALIQGKFDSVNLEYVKSHMDGASGIRYVEIQMDDDGRAEEISDKEKRGFQRQLYQYCIEFLGPHASHCVFDVSTHEKIYDIGLLYCDAFAKEQGIDGKTYLNRFLEYLIANMHQPVIMLVGKKVQDISNIARSYGNACMLRSFQGFRAKKPIYYYEEEVQVTSEGIVLCKSSLDRLLKAVEQNNHVEIRSAIEQFYGEMISREMTGETMNLNINYLLFQLIHLASEQDDGVNQEEILRLISESSFEKGVMRGSKAHLTRFACEYGDYLSQLRKNVSRGVLGEIEREIRENYAKNITLKSLSEKYYVNSAYLGQLFRKKNGQSFKDYLNNYRMERAADLLLHTDKKIVEIAEEVGYHDLDYFVNRFILVKGCTPAKFRREA